LCQRDAGRGREQRGEGHAKSLSQVKHATNPY
jgi:hypothetical protein